MENANTTKKFTLKNKDFRITEKLIELSHNVFLHIKNDDVISGSNLIRNTTISYRAVYDYLNILKKYDLIEYENITGRRKKIIVKDELFFKSCYNIINTRNRVRRDFDCRN